MRRGLEERMDLLYRSSEITEAPFDFSGDVLKRALLNIYGKDFNPDSDIELNLFNELSGIFDKAAETGIESSRNTDPDEWFIKELRHGNAVFSAFKTHRAQKEMARLMLDSNGDLKPFEQWMNDVLPIAEHQTGSWLRTEYDTAVLRARQAADWRQFEREKDVLPNLRWMPSTSPNPGEDHRVFWGTVRPVDDPFWNRHRPGDRWNCKCSLSSTDDPATPVPVSPQTPGDNPHPGLKGNPGKSGGVFSDDHPYFPDNCGVCPFNGGFSNTLSRFFGARRKKDCFRCKPLDRKLAKLSDPVYLARKDYYGLKHDPEYYDVKLDKKSGGVRATHIGHNTDTGKKEFFNNTMSGADLEEACVTQLFKAGHKVILLDESKEIAKGKKAAALDIELDGQTMDIRSITGRGWYSNVLKAKNKQLKKYNARPDIKHPANALCLYFHDAKMFNEDNLLRSINRYKFDYDNHGYRIIPLIKRIYIIINGHEEMLQYDV